jgi:hypothetical protein
MFLQLKMEKRKAVSIPSLQQACQFTSLFIFTVTNSSGHYSRWLTKIIIHSWADTLAVNTA